MRQLTMITAGSLAAFAMLAAPASAAHVRHHYYHHNSGYSGPGYAPGYTADPSRMPNPLLNFYRTYHICAIDEGYGRATRCD